VEAGATRVRSVWPRLARGGATGLLAVTVAFDETAMAWGPGDRVRLHAAGSLGRADYGLTVLTAAHAERAGRLVSFILSPEGQAILTRHGFAAPTGPGG
jgi:molybdate transport system substrate-binding protein